jgi:hypothetical protein
VDPDHERPFPTASLSYNALAVDPSDSHRLVVSAGSIVFLSTDSGANWSPVLSQFTRGVWFDPVNPSNVFALGLTDLWRSGQQGANNWASVNHHRLAEVHGLAFMADRPATCSWRAATASLTASTAACHSSIATRA